MSYVCTDYNINRCVEKINEIDSDDLQLEVQNVKNHSARKTKTCYTEVLTKIKIDRAGPRKTVKVRQHPLSNPFPEFNKEFIIYCVCKFKPLLSHCAIKDIC